MKNRKEYGSGVVATIRYYADYLLEAFNNLDRGRKTIFVVGTASIILIIVVMSVFFTSPHYTALYTNLDTADAASIAAYLKNNKIPYEIAGDGSTIMVPDSQKYQVRLDLANSNLPAGGVVGFETFDTTHFGETDTEEKVRFIAALQGELERTIGKIDGVQDVRVHIVQPEPALFVQDQKDATASVLLKMTPGYNLQSAEVLGITHLVAGGVEGLKPENVTVIDTSGNILSDNSPDASQGVLSSDQSKIKQDYEKQLQDSVQSMLERVVGQGKVVVRANATMNFDQVVIDSENYGDSQVASDHTIQETTTDGATSGSPGTSSNTPGTTTPTYSQVTGQNGDLTQKSDKTTDYDVNTQTEHRVVAPGQIKQLSLSVIIDGQLDPATQQQIEGMVTAAAGIDTTRGDRLTVAGMPFNNVAENQATQEMNQAEVRQEFFDGAYILLAVIFAFLLLRYVRKLWGRLTQERVGGVASEDILTGRHLDMRIEDEQESETRQVLDRLRALAKSKPDETLTALRSWLTGD